MTTEELLARVINHLAEKFKGPLILKGGMLLRLLNSPRSTRDIDYVLVTKKSRKIPAQTLKEILQELKDVTVTDVRLNSRGIFIDIEETGGQKAMLEISIASSTYLPPEPLSTAPLANRYSLSGRVISTMALPEAFAHKIAATLERDVVRDLYDIHQFEFLGPFDIGTLSARLSKLSVGRQKPQSITFPEAAKMLRKKIEALTEERLKTELYPLIPVDQQTGLLRLIQASLYRVIGRLEDPTLLHAK